MQHRVRFTNKEGTVLYCKLLQPDLTNFTKIENIRFLPALEFLCRDPRAAPSDLGTQYDLDDLDDAEVEADSANYRCSVVDSHCKNNSLMKRILRNIMGGCFGGQSAKTPEQEHEQTPQHSHLPGKELATTAATDGRLPRNRKRGGRSESDDSA
ncbi:unnamed protein product [Eruca vesicaria subsp. sativa]|uniref:Uncharacterized protein n=1 Tax=Eruca vesicaria subsp. sativa TaxID=29727 RepID=A0ABC8JXV1_ERUVS|nr:unnamed protein product [Eruca vesicaria subsp. sativa]